MPERGFSGDGGSAGFTLIEIMVALAVFSLAALALMRLESATIRGAATLDATVAAGMVAQSVAVDAMTSAQLPAAGTQRGSETNGGRSWSWTRNVSAIGGGQVMRIDVAVADQRGGSVLARSTLVRPAVQEQAQ